MGGLAHTPQWFEVQKSYKEYHMMLKFAAPLAVVLGLAAGPSLADDTPSPSETAAAATCAQVLGYSGVTGESVVVVPRGAASVNLKRYDTAASGKPAAQVSVAPFDLSSCQPVELRIWVQDQMGETVNSQTTALATFPGTHFAKGVNYLRADRALNRDLGFLIRGLN